MSRLLRTILHVCTMVLFSLTAFGQNRVLTGILFNEKGNTLPNAKISVKNSALTANSDADGKFSIEVPETARTIIFSFIGMDPKEMPIGNTLFFNVTLSPVGTNTKEVVVIGYGTAKRKDVTSAVGSVSFADVRTTPQPSVDQLLQGRMAGVQVTQNSGQPGSATSLRVRGVTSLGNSEPLYVIDGVAISGFTNGTADNSGTRGSARFIGSSDGQTSQSPLAALNPSDIVSVDVLKDASAQAIYGNRASNGVVIITTKRGRTGDAKIAYDGFTAFSTIRKKIDLMNLREFAGYYNTLNNTGVNGPRDQPEFADPSVLGKGTDWQDAITTRGVQHNHNLSISGGKDQTTYFFSGGLTDQTGTIVGSNFKRYNLRMNIDTRVKEFLKMGISLNGSKTNERIILADAFDGIVGQAVQMSPAVPVYDLNGNFAAPSTFDVQNGAPASNPFAEATLLKNTAGRNKLFGSVYAEIGFLKNFTFRADVSGDFNFGRSDLFLPKRGFGNNPNNDPFIGTNRDESFWWNASQTINYNKTLNKVHQIGLLVGHEANSSTWEWLGASRVGNATGIPFITAFSSVGQGLSGGKGSASMESFFTRASYTYDNRFIVSGTFRRDGSSKFDPTGQNIWGNFYGFSGAWKISEEKFMRNIDWISAAKIRGGYGEVGNQNIAPYLFTVALNNILPSDVAQLEQANIKSRKLIWEATIQSNIGAEFTLFNKVDVTVDYFNKASRDFLLQVPYAAYLGSLSYTANSGKMENKGLEVSINSKNVSTKNFSWNTSFNFTHIKNEVSDIKASIVKSPSQQQQDATNLVITQNNSPVSQFYGYKVKDIFRNARQVLDAPRQFGLTPNADNTTYWIGDIQYEDVNNDGVVNEKDKTVIGNPLPKFTVGLTNNFSYKGFDLGVFLTASYGNDVFNLLRYRTEQMYSPNANQTRNVLDYFDIENLNNPRNATTMTPRPRFGKANNYNAIAESDRWVEDGSFLRIQNVTLSYSIPTDLVRRMKLNKLRLYVSGQNLHVFSKYKGLDPEIGSFNQDPTVTGVDVGRYPSPRTVTVGASIEF